MNNFHRFQNFRQSSTSFSQIRLKRRHTSLFSGICREIRTNFIKNSRKKRISDFFHFFRQILHFLLQVFDEFLSGFRDKFQKRVTSVAFSIEFAETNQKIAENSEICENYSSFFIIIHSCP